jgi:hypothetical protein
MVSQSATKKYDGNKCQTCGKPLTHGEQGDTCKAHEGKIRATAEEVPVAPENWIKMSDVCRAAEEQGLKTSQVVRASGGDACTLPIMDPVFKVAYVGKRKYMNPDVMTKGFAMLKAHQAEKPVRPVTASAEEASAIAAVLSEESAEA